MDRQHAVPSVDPVQTTGQDATRKWFTTGPNPVVRRTVATPSAPPEFDTGAWEARMLNSTEVSLAEPTMPGSVAVWFDGRRYQAYPIAKGAAYELFTAAPVDGFLPNPRPGALLGYRRFVHATAVVPADGPQPDANGSTVLDAPMCMPVAPGLNWATVHHYSQIPPGRCAPGFSAMTGAIRRSARLSTGTAMMKVLSAKQVAGMLLGRSIAGFCHRSYDLAHLRTPADLSALTGTNDPAEEVVFALRWKVVDPADYATPLIGIAGGEVDGSGAIASGAQVDVSGLAGLPAAERVGPHVLGTGFSPNSRHLVPEWVTADFADLPMPVGTSLTAYTPDGSEVVLYTYQPHEHAWLRMCGPQWRHLLEHVPLAGSPGQEYIAVATPPLRLIGRYADRVVPAVADPPHGPRAAAKAAAVRHPVTDLTRRVHFAKWRGVEGTVLGTRGDWAHLRLCRPQVDEVERVAAMCSERGLYEAWAPVSELSDHRDVEITYPGRPAAAPR